MAKAQIFYLPIWPTGFEFYRPAPNFIGNWPMAGGESSNFLPANLADRFWILPASAEFYRQLADGRRLSPSLFIIRLYGIYALCIFTLYSLEVIQSFIGNILERTPIDTFYTAVVSFKSILGYVPWDCHSLERTLGYGLAKVPTLGLNSVPQKSLEDVIVRTSWNGPLLWHVLIFFLGN